MSEMHNYCDCGDYCEWCHPEMCGVKETLKDLLGRFHWLLRELHGGNEFSKDFYWGELKRVEAALLRKKVLRKRR